MKYKHFGGVWDAALGPEGPWGWVLNTGFGFGPGGPEGPEGPFQLLGWMLVFCVRIEVVNSVS